MNIVCYETDMILPRDSLYIFYMNMVLFAWGKWRCDDDLNGALTLCMLWWFIEYCSLHIDDDAQGTLTFQCMLCVEWEWWDDFKNLF
jgi:hypothetical protein